MDRILPGVVVPIPTYPLVSTMKSVCVEDPTAKDGPLMPLGLIENNPQGEVVEMPKLPDTDEAFTCKTIQSPSVGAQPGSSVSPGANEAETLDERAKKDTNAPKQTNALVKRKRLMNTHNYSTIFCSITPFFAENTGEVWTSV